MLRTTTGTRDRIIQSADDLFYREGFHAVGLDRILRLAGVTKTTFYNHFESKEQLVVETLRAHDRWWRDTFLKLLREHGGDDPRAQLLALVEVFRYLVEMDCYNGCIFVNVAVEFPLPHDPAHVIAVEHKQELGLVLRDLALRAGASDPVALADELGLILEGAYVTHQVMPRDETVETLARLVRAAVERYCAAR